jgi:DNA-binding transcriptional regulator YhcF (GntR family)
MFRYRISYMITIDAVGGAPPYEQIRSQVVAMVESKELLPGARLPTVRRLALDLGVAANTVARAYRELEQAGVIETRGRGGSFVTGEGVEREAKAAAAAYVAQVRALGLSPRDALALVGRLLDKPIT